MVKHIPVNFQKVLLIDVISSKIFPKEQINQLQMPDIDTN